ncbi:putative type III secretion apparatus [Sodalis glossinidius str. 'morsitans']|uniref:Type III secretion apparatus n=1 Tax=Sodalis glossinidius (strain morsitans) TaxID=343509 RepID=Q2NTE8_SODGM|nr:putative type III secretion apparatus [Sodalis glossinidius str. 'morsitans']
MLHLKTQREMRFRRALAGVSREERQNEAATGEGDARLAQLARTRHDLLSWRGMATVGTLGRKTLEMQGVLQRVYALSDELRHLRQARATLRDRRRDLQEARVILLKKQEKLKQVLTDEQYQN